MNYPMNVETAKNSKLFKKFMENKNKPALFNIMTPTQTEPINLLNECHLNKDSIYFPHIRNENVNIGNIMAENSNETGEVYGGLEESKKRKTSGQENEEVNNITSKTIILSKSRKADKTTDTKYERLLEEHNELKEEITNERKELKKEKLRQELEIENLHKKIFELRNREDESIMENKRIKEKSAIETKLKQELEENNRQLTYEISELKELLDGQSNNAQLKEGDAIHWRKLNEELKERNRELEQQVCIMKDANHVLEREKLAAEKSSANKEKHLDEMRQKINSLITENGNIKDELFHITSKMYHIEQENKMLKVDSRRKVEEFPISYLHEQLQEASRLQTRSQYEPSLNNPNSNKTMNGELKDVTNQNDRRRGEFARERGAKRVENQQNLAVNEVKLQCSGENKEYSEALIKFEQLDEELKKLKDCKAMNGAMRRQKINIEREMLELEEVLKSKK